MVTKKPGIQAVGNTLEDHPVWRGDYEYVRFGTLSLLAVIDLLTGKAIRLLVQPIRVLILSVS